MEPETLTKPRQSIYTPLLFVPKQIDVSLILNAVSKATDIPVNEILCNCRKRDYVMCRQIVMRLAYEFTKKTYAQIGSRMGRDHSTVIYACKNIDNLIESKDKMVMTFYPELYHRLRRLQDEIRRYNPGLSEDIADTIINTEK